MELNNIFWYKFQLFHASDLDIDMIMSFKVFLFNITHIYVDRTFFILEIERAKKIMFAQNFKLLLLFPFPG